MPGIPKDGEDEVEVVSPDEDVARLTAELEAEKKRGDDLLTRLKYMQADFENYRKRAEKDTKEAGEMTLRSLVMKLLDVLDELDLAVQNCEKNGQAEELLEGVKMVRKKLSAALASEGLMQIDSIGKPFDPGLHEAVEKVEGSSEGGDVVIGEVRKGFVFRGQVIRPSMVKVQLASRATGAEVQASE